MSKVTIYHNPKCSKSRKTLELIESRGIKPNIVLYLENTPNADELTRILGQLSMAPRELLRTGEQSYTEMQLDTENLTDELIIEAMTQTPILIQRPIISCNGKAVIGRPPETVFDIL